MAPVIAKGQYYPAEDVAKPAKRSLKPTVAKLRASIQPGSVVILLAGRFKGRRVVVLQQLKSGLLLVSGEFAARAYPRLLRTRARDCSVVASRALLLTLHPLIHAGPYAVNGVPLRRVNQSYVIATSTKVDVSKVDLSGIDESLFSAKAEKAAKKLPKKDSAAFFALQRAEGKAETSDARKALQTKVDGAIKVTEAVAKYLKARFSLTKNDKPHAMKF